MDTRLPGNIADVEVVRLDATDLSRLPRLCAACTDFFELVEGLPGGEATAAEILGPLPPELAVGTRHVFGLAKAGELVGVVDLLQGYPSPQEWYIGLLLLLPEYRRRGLGARFCTEILSWIRLRGGVAVRLIVQHQNPLARVFWEQMGFSVEREVVTQAGSLASPVWVLLRATGRAAQIDVVVDTGSPAICGP